ncbi:hypothetical protein BGW36DRAFT_304224, partial [Talaromyces proteolyticus]
LYKASVKELAETGTIKVGSSIADIKDTIVQRIKKYLQRANHPRYTGSGSQSSTSLGVRMQYSRQSIATIQRVDSDTSKPVNKQSYVDAHQIAIF